MNPVDDGEVRSTGEEVEMPQDEIDMDTEGQRAADAEVVDKPQTDHGNGEAPLPEMPAPPEPHPLPRPRAKGVKHPPVPTKAQVEKHALEQHVNYAPWFPHCAQASALMR